MEIAIRNADSACVTFIFLTVGNASRRPERILARWFSKFKNKLNHLSVWSSGVGSRSRRSLGIVQDHNSSRRMYPGTSILKRPKILKQVFWPAAGAPGAAVI